QGSTESRPTNQFTAPTTFVELVTVNFSPLAGLMTTLLKVIPFAMSTVAPSPAEILQFLKRTFAIGELVRPATMMAVVAFVQLMFSTVTFFNVGGTGAFAPSLFTL